MQTTYRSTGLPQRPINMQREEGRDSAMLYFSKSQRSCRRGLMERYQAEWECRSKIHAGRRKLRSTAQWSLLTQMLQRPSLFWELVRNTAQSPCHTERTRIFTSAVSPQDSYNHTWEAAAHQHQTYTTAWVLFKLLLTTHLVSASVTSNTGLSMYGWYRQRILSSPSKFIGNQITCML